MAGAHPVRRAAVVNLGDGLAGRVLPGEGELIVAWIHGYALESRIWWPLWLRLPGPRHVGIDLPGHGHSLPLSPGESLPGLAQRVGEAALAAGARHLVGYSSGTIVALQVALEFPGRFESLTLAGPMLGGGPFETDAFGPSLYADASASAEIDADVEQILARHPAWKGGHDAWVELLHSAQKLKDVATVEVPTLVLTGERDRATVRQTSDFLARLLPTHRREELAGAGHLAPLATAERTSELLEAHWRAGDRAAVAVGA